jgi:very-short-patch-repair endonuclease
VRRRVTAGDWQVVVGRVLALGGRQIAPGVLDRALALALPDAVLAGASAARLHGIAVPTTSSCLFTRSHADLGRTGLRLLRDPVAPKDLVILDGLLATKRPRTIFDLLRTLDRQQASELLDRALQQRWIGLDELVSRVRAHSGRLGAPQLVTLVGQAAAGAHSTAERLAVALLRRARITGWAANSDICDSAGRRIAVGDLVFRTQRLVVEIDGRAHHVSAEQFQRDRARQNQLVAAGWTVLRFTWADLTQRPDQMVAVVRRLVA